MIFRLLEFRVGFGNIGFGSAFLALGQRSVLGDFGRVAHFRRRTFGVVAGMHDER